MHIKIYQVDAFADSQFEGNPAAVCPLDHWLSDELMQNIAAENNLSETAFFLPYRDHFHIRWFTPATEVDLCGHATLAAAHVLYQHENYQGAHIRFHSRSGELKVEKSGDWLALNFPTDTLQAITAPPPLAKALLVHIRECYRGKDDYLVIIDQEQQLANLQPDFSLLASLPSRGVIVSAPGEQTDFVSRCFFPQCGIDEDPVTGSAHTALIPYWSKRLGKTQMEARQISRRGGRLKCQYLGQRVIIAGRAVSYMEGNLVLHDI